MNRRTLVKGSLTLGAGALLGAQLASCSPPPAPSPAPSQPRVAPEASTGPASSKVLLAYFSRAGENYYYGDRIDLEVGNTEVVANMIASTIRSTSTGSRPPTRTRELRRNSGTQQTGTRR